MLVGEYFGEVEPETGDDFHYIKQAPEQQKHVHGLHDCEDVAGLSPHSLDLLPNAMDDEDDGE